jgi:hypothetical protein
MREARQLTLDMALPEIDPAGSAPPWTYRFTPDGLVEENGRFRYIYGFWSGLFGCWEIDLETNKSLEIALKPLVLTRDDRFLKNEMAWHPRLARPSNSDDASNDASLRWRFEAKAAFSGFFSRIPAHIRNLADRMGPYHWVALDLMWQVPGFAGFVEHEIYNHRQQYLFACFALTNIAGSSRSRRRKYAEAIMFQRRRKILTKLTRTPCTKSTLNALYKLGDKPLPGNVYRKLAVAMELPGAAKVLRHLDTINPEVPGTLLDVSGDLWIPNLFAIWCWGISARDVMTEISEICNELPLSDRRRCIAALREVRDFKDLDAWSTKWHPLAFDHQLFPEPPLPGDDLFHPLTDSRVLRREGQRMRNCTATYAKHVLEGTAYFYHWSGLEPATVMLIRCDVGWVLAEALGKRNSEISPWTRYEIRQRIWWQRGILHGKWSSPPQMPGQPGRPNPRLSEGGGR